MQSANLTDLILPILAVGGLAVATILFAILIGRWIDSQSNSVLDEPRERPRRER